MTKLTDLEYLQLSKLNKIWYNFLMFFINFGKGFVNFGKKIGNSFVKIYVSIIKEFRFLGRTFKNGDIFTKLSYFIMGIGSFRRKQILRGILFLTFEITFIMYMIFFGGHQLGMLFHSGSIGYVETSQVECYSALKGTYYVTIYGDDSFRILNYSVLTFFFMGALIWTWRLNIKQNAINEELKAKGKHISTAKEDLRALLDEQFHKTLLALPVIGILLFTVIPIVFMVIVAFTNYDAKADGFNKLWHFVGFKNFNEFFRFDNGLSVAFREILGWTIIWAFFATFSNYFLGILVAMMINKKGIKYKKLWRGLLVLSSAVPQFISLLYVSKFFGKVGFWSAFTKSLGWNNGRGYQIWENKHSARLGVILINIWIGIPYLMLITSGVLMNIPADLYESARIDGANPFQQLTKITLPYMFFVTGPYLLTSFTGNLNNFNVIFLLTGGLPRNTSLMQCGAEGGDTDLLITFLYKLATGTNTDYKFASVIGIFIFIFIATFSLIIYNILPSNKNEEDFS